MTDVDHEFASDVREGLTDDPKHVPPKWLYDERGSKLFEQITELDEYYLTDVERSIFEDHAEDIVARCPRGSDLVELGAGSADKTRHLLAALVDRQGDTVFQPIDISRKAIEMAQQRVESQFDRVEVVPIVGDYAEGLRRLRDTEQARLIAFIGSSIGNIPMDEQRDLLQSVHDAMRPDDRFLLGTDMRKDTSTLLPAYDDSEGVTAEFTLNLLRRINRELDADFDLDRFEHRAVFEEDKSAVVIYAESQADQTVTVGALDLTVDFAEGERIHVEDSHKYTEPMLDRIVGAVGLEREASWYDENGWFGEHLFRPVDRSP